MLFNELWRAEDSEDGPRAVCEFNRVTPEKRDGGGNPFYQFSMVEGRFSGYPTVNFDLDDLKKLHKAIGEEIRLQTGQQETVEGTLIVLGEGWSEYALPQQRKPADE